jgi:hypothetical protein
VGIAAAVAGLSILCLPRRLWVSQLQRLGFICGLILLFTAIGSDSVPPLLQQHSLPGSVEGLNVRLTPDTPYSYVLVDLGGLITVTRRYVLVTIRKTAVCMCAACLCDTELGWLPRPFMSTALNICKVCCKPIY